MMGHQAGNAIASTDPAQKAGTVERVEPSVGHRRAVPDVMQPGRRYQGTISQPKSLSNTLRPVPNTLDMPPPSRQLGQTALGQNPRISGRHHGFEPMRRTGRQSHPRPLHGGGIGWMRRPRHGCGRGRAASGVGS
jgi:hypothetical protein